MRSQWPCPFSSWSPFWPCVLLLCTKTQIKQTDFFVLLNLSSILFTFITIIGTHPSTNIRRMVTACESFFTLPELITLVTPHLSRQDIVYLILTNRRLCSICTPLLWHSIHLIGENLFVHANTAQACLLASPEGLQALYNNIDAVRAVYWKDNFTWSYLHAALAYIVITPTRSSPGPDALEETEQDITSTDALTHPFCGGMAIPASLPAIRLPQLRRLIIYKAFIGTDIYGSSNADLPSG